MIIINLVFAINTFSLLLLNWFFFISNWAIKESCKKLFYSLYLAITLIVMSLRETIRCSSNFYKLIFFFSMLWFSLFDTVGVGPLIIMVILENIYFLRIFLGMWFGTLKTIRAGFFLWYVNWRDVRNESVFKSYELGWLWILRDLEQCAAEKF